MNVYYICFGVIKFLCRESYRMYFMGQNLASFANTTGKQGLGFRAYA